MRKKRILLGDDHSLILEGLRGLLSADYEVAGVASDGKTLAEAAARLAPDIVVLDIAMPVLNGIDAAREIRKATPSTRLLFLSMHSSAVYLRRAFEAGASGYVLKSGAAEELLNAIEVVLSGGAYVSPGFGVDLHRLLREHAEDSQAGLQLTARQRQILQLIGEGRQNKEIAELLCISVKTVEYHRARLMSQLGARTAAELARFALREGLIIDPE